MLGENLPKFCFLLVDRWLHPNAIFHRNFSNLHLRCTSKQKPTNNKSMCFSLSTSSCTMIHFFLRYFVSKPWQGSLKCHLTSKTDFFHEFSGVSVFSISIRILTNFSTTFSSHPPPPLIAIYLLLHHNFFFTKYHTFFFSFKDGILNPHLFHSLHQISSYITT